MHCFVLCFNHFQTHEIFIHLYKVSISFKIKKCPYSFLMTILALEITPTSYYILQQFDLQIIPFFVEYHVFNFHVQVPLHPKKFLLQPHLSHKLTLELSAFPTILHNFLFKLYPPSSENALSNNHDN